MYYYQHIKDQYKTQQLLHDTTYNMIIITEISS